MTNSIKLIILCVKALPVIAITAYTMVYLFTVDEKAFAQHHTAYQIDTGAAAVNETALSSTSFRQTYLSMGNSCFQYQNKLYVLCKRANAGAAKAVLFRSLDNAVTWDSVYASGNYSDVTFRNATDSGLSGAIANDSLMIFDNTDGDSARMSIWSMSSDALLSTSITEDDGSNPKSSSSIAYGKGVFVAVSTRSGSPAELNYNYFSGGSWGSSTWISINPESTGPWESSVAFCANSDSFEVIVVKNDNAKAVDWVTFDGTTSGYKNKPASVTPLQDFNEYQVSATNLYSLCHIESIDSGKVAAVAILNTSSGRAYYSEYTGTTWKASEQPFKGSGAQRSPFISYINDTVFVACIVDAGTDSIRVVKRTGVDQFQTVLQSTNAAVTSGIGMMDFANFEVNNHFRRRGLLR